MRSLAVALLLTCPVVLAPVTRAQDAPPANEAGAPAAAMADLEKLIGELRSVPPANRPKHLAEAFTATSAFLDTHGAAATQEQLLKAGRWWFGLANATQAPEQVVRDRLAQLRALPSLPPELAGLIRGEQARLDLKEGAPAPNWTAVDIHDGSQVTLEGLRGKIVLMDFWATWCGPCLALMERKLKPMFERYGADERLVMVSIGVPWQGETIEKERAFAAKHPEYGWLKVFDASGDAPQSYGVQGIPTLVLVDTDGKILKLGVGGRVIGDIEAILAQRLGAQAEPGK